MQHPYCYPGTDVLKNRHDIRDASDLEALERHLSFERLKFLSYLIPMTPAGFRYIHRHMLQDVYDWAGQYRSLDTGRTGPFCRAQFIKASMNKQFAALNAEGDLRGLDAKTFAERAAEHGGEFNRIHPFLDGNGRTLRAFLERLGEQAGHRIDLARIDPDAWNQASVVSFHRFDNRPLADIIAGTIIAPGHRQETGHTVAIDPCEPRRNLEPQPPAHPADDDFDL